MKLIFVHGRAQETFNAEDLKAEWTNALKDGLAKSGLALPNDVSIAYPYYGKLLINLVNNLHLIPNERSLLDDSPAITVRKFNKQFLNQLYTNLEYGSHQERGILSSEFLHKILQKLDHAEGWGIAAVKRFTKDVFHYITHKGLRNRVNEYVLKKFDNPDNEPCVIVAHSLGTVVTYFLLRENPHLKVKKLITIGSPLGLTAIAENLPQPLIMPECIQNGWYNAYDEGDFVALNPLDKTNFPIEYDIENNNTIKNPTSNRHGAVGYLSHKTVAQKIHEALLM